MGSGNGVSGSGVSDDEPEDLDEEEEGSDEEEEEEVEEEEEEKPKKKSKKASAAEPEPKRKRGRPRGPIGRVPDRVGKDDEQADLLWMKILDEMENKIGDFAGKDASPRDMFIRVNRVDPGPFFNCGTLQAAAITTDDQKSGADKLRDAVIDRYHGTCQSAARYEVLFMWKRGTTFYHRGVLDLPAPWEIKAWREWEGAQPGAGGAPPGVGRIPGAPSPPPQQPQAPWMQQQPQQPYYGPGQGNGYPPPYGPPSGYGPQQPQRQHDERDTLIREQREELKRLNTRLDSLERPAAPAAPVARPAITIEELSQLTASLKPLGLGVIPLVGAQPPAAHVPAAPPPAAASKKDERDDEEELLARIERNRDLEKRAKKLFGIKDEPEEEEEEEEEKPKDQGPGLGTHFYPIPGAQWPDGSVPQVAKTDEGEYDVMGMLAANPFFVNKFGAVAFGLASKLAGMGKVQEPEETPVEEPKIEHHRKREEPKEEKPSTKKSGGFGEL